MYVTRNTKTKNQRRGVLLPPQKGKAGRLKQMKAVEWLKRKLHVESDNTVIGKRHYEKCDEETCKELEESYTTYLIMKDKGYEPNDILIILEYDEETGKFTGKKYTRQIYSVETDSEGIVDGYCVLMVEDMGLAAWKVK